MTRPLLTVTPAQVLVLLWPVPVVEICLAAALAPVPQVRKG